MTGTPAATQRAVLDAWAEAGLSRSVRVETGTDFVSNDYLDLAVDPRLRQAAIEVLETQRIGSAGSRLLGGTHPEHLALESEAADWLHAEAALHLASGYQANLALLQVLTDPRDVILSDALNHASLIDGCRLSAAAVEIVPHTDLQALERALVANAQARHRYVLVESVYSMDGDESDLEALDALCKAHDAWLLVDEAHAAGLHGEQGRGRAAGFERVLARVITGGKALGVSGALLAGPRWLVQSVLERGRSFVYTTGAPPALAAALRAAIRIVRSEAPRREAALAHGALLRRALTERNVSAGGAGAIVTVPLGDPDRAMRVQQDLAEQGLAIRAARPPTVPRGASRLRLVCRSGHTHADLHQAADAVARACARHEATTPPVAVSQTTPWVVVGTDTDAGKTIASAALVVAARLAGHTPRYLKPVQTGTIVDTPAVAALSSAPDACRDAPIVSLPDPASVDQAAEAVGTTVTVADVEAGVRARLAEDPNVLWILETAGGLLVPFNDREDQADLLRRLRGRHLLVARSGLGTLNHTRLTLEAMAARRLRPEALLLCGPRHAANEKTLATWFPALRQFHLPWLDPLTPDHLETAVRHAGLAELFQ